MKIRLTVSLITLFLSTSLFGQVIEDVIEIRDGSQFEYDLGIGRKVIDDNGNIYYIQSQPTYGYRFGDKVLSEGGLLVNDDFLERGSILDSMYENGHSWYIIKFNADFEYLHSTVIKNIAVNTNPPSLSLNNDRLHLLINSQYGIDIMVEDSILTSSGDKRESWILTFDTDLGLDHITHFPNKHIKEICGANEEDEIYLGFTIRRDEYITLGLDTIWNYVYSQSPPFYPNTAVISKYNYAEEKFLWAHKFGDLNGSEIRKLQLDDFGDLIIMGFVGGSNVYIGDGIDTLEASGVGIDRWVLAESILLKFTSSGEYVWGVTTPKGRWDVFWDFQFDSKGDIYVRALYKADTLFIRDTMFLYTMPDDMGSKEHQVILKFTREGKFAWGHQPEGVYTQHSHFFINMGSSNKLYVSGSFIGSLEIEDTVLMTTSNGNDWDRMNYLYRLDEDGNNEDLIYSAHRGEPSIQGISELEGGEYMFIVDLHNLNSIFNRYFEDPRPTLFCKVDMNKVVDAGYNYIENIPEVFAYPNPVSESHSVYIDINEKVTAEPAFIHLYNASGKMVLSSEAVIVDGTTQLQLPQSMASGTYFIRLEYGEKSAMGKLVVQ